jgi:hypothetical protein
MTDSNEGMHCPLGVDDHVRIVSSAMLDEMGLIGIVKKIIEGGRGTHRITGQVIAFTETAYMVDVTGEVLFGRNCLYKLPPDFFTVTNLEGAQRIRELLLTHVED